jgi:hypothetical protein
MRSLGQQAVAQRENTREWFLRFLGQLNKKKAGRMNAQVLMLAGTFTAAGHGTVYGHNSHTDQANIIRGAASARSWLTQCAGRAWQVTSWHSCVFSLASRTPAILAIVIGSPGADDVSLQRSVPHRHHPPGCRNCFPTALMALGSAEAAASVTPQVSQQQATQAMEQAQAHPAQLRMARAQAVPQVKHRLVAQGPQNPRRSPHDETR